MLLPITDIKHVLEENHIDISGIFHVGAHTCEELSLYPELGISPESIIWIDALETNVINAKNRGIPNVYTATITDKDDEDIVFNITNNVCSSSVFELGTHMQEHPEVVYVNKINTKTITVDTFFSRNTIDASKYNFWNFDIQGAELLALKGSIENIKHASAIYLEVNTKELYKNCALLSEIDVFLSEFNFKRVLTSMTQHAWGDALYIRNA